MKKFYWANFFLNTFEYEVLFMDFHFNMGIYRGLDMDSLKNDTVMNSKMHVFMQIHFNKLLGVDKDGRNPYFTFVIHFNSFVIEKIGNFLQKSMIFHHF